MCEYTNELQAKVTIASSKSMCALSVTYDARLIFMRVVPTYSPIGTVSTCSFIYTKDK